MHIRFITALLISLATSTTWAIDLGNESMAEKADRFDFEEFHKEKGIVIWEGQKKEAATYEEKPVPPASGNRDSGDDKRRFEKGQDLKVREAYKLGNDPALRQIPSLFEATEALHKQLNSYCPKGWAKKEEWHKPEQNYYFIHYMAVCL